MQDFLTLAHERYSCRKLSDAPVEAEKIDALLEAAICAPTACNKQPWHAWVIESPEAIERLGDCTRFVFGAHTVIAIGAKAENGWVRKSDGRAFADVDAAIVATHVMLAAQDLDLGTTWVGAFDTSAFAEAFPETADYDMVALFPIGYPADDAEPGPLHPTRKDASELVSRI